MLLLTKNAYLMAESIFEMDRERLSQTLLQKVPIMRNWPLTKIIDISEHFKVRTFEPGEVIYDIGDKSDHIYFINDGKV